ncbi:MAG: hypothetical protein LM583_09435 [Desulfurococcaceae archaeon]|nr:hypothetical protein [Desulfurococcaceae archaeon]
MSSPTPVQNLVQNKINEIVRKIMEEITELYTAFKESKEEISGKKIIDANRVNTRYCYAVDVMIRMHPEVKIGLRVVCELDFEIHDNDVFDWSDIKSRKEMLILKLLKL